MTHYQRLGWVGGHAGCAPVLPPCFQTRHRAPGRETAYTPHTGRG
jgi:hypothetical protein